MSEQTVVLTAQALKGVMRLRRSGERGVLTDRWGQKVIYDSWALSAMALGLGMKVVDSADPSALMTAHAMPLQCFRPCISEGCMLCRGHQGECVRA